MSGEWETEPGTRNELATAPLTLHGGPRILVLPNAWDAASARDGERPDPSGWSLWLP